MNLNCSELKDHIELLNNLKYTNYGQVRESNSIDISATNRLSICTDKCLFILNQNFEWPSQLNNSSPFKFFIDHKTHTEKNKHQVQIDEWIQDLNESKNETFYINVIRSVPKSESFLKIFIKFQDLAEYKNSKHKSFQKQLQFMYKRSNTNDPELINKNLVNKDNKLFSNLKDHNYEEFMYHKVLFDQSRLLDPDYYQFLSFLNPYSSGAAQENDLQNAFKFCKWNLNTKINLLFTLTEYNRMIIFDCTNFTNTTNSLKEDKNSNYIKIFDFKSNSKMIDLTEFFINRHNHDLIDHKFKDIEDFFVCLSKIIPITASWGPEIYTKNGLEYEILLIGLKSNQIAIFYIFSDLTIELFKLIDLSKSLSNEMIDEKIDTSIDAREMVKITNVKLGKNGILAVTLSDGRVAIQKYFDDKFAFFDMRLIGLIKKITFDYINQEVFILITQTELEIGFFLFNKLEIKSELIYRLDDKKYSNYIQKPVKNYLTQGLFKLIDLKQLENLSFLLIFENGLIDLVQLQVNNLRLSAMNSVLNISVNLNFNSIFDSNQDIFKTIKQVRFSKNKLILYQINDFGKSCLIQKRPANFEVNVYRLKRLNKKMLEDFFIQNSNSTVNDLNDFIWLVKNDLYFNSKVFLNENFDVIYENFKNYRTLVQDKKDKIVYLKRTRILAYLMRNYFETLANFDSFNEKIGADLDESSEDSDYRDEDEIDHESKANKKIDDDSSMVKSVSFYDLVFRETSLLIFKYYCVDFIKKACSKEFDKLEAFEKRLLLQMGKFGIKKNFFQKNEYGSVFKQLEEWIKKILENCCENDLSKLCDLCGKKFSIDGNLNLNKIKCISGHNMNRCEKTLMPLNNFKFKKCALCNSKWNFIESTNEMTKNFQDCFFNQINSCLYCD